VKWGIPVGGLLSAVQPEGVLFLPILCVHDW
jgi:hypothetical protein